jgi:hypothetical protein
MVIAPVEPNSYLYACSDVFPAAILEQIVATDWATLPYQRLSIGFGRRRQILDHAVPGNADVREFVQQQLRTHLQTQCQIQFENQTFCNIQWWLDEPGFKPQIHSDGDLPSAVQIYLLPTADTDLGTTFFRSRTKTDVLHRFSSLVNTGYIMFNSHSVNGVRPVLWHDMEQAVPPTVHRVCCYITLGSYCRI